MNISDFPEIISRKKKEYFEKIENFCKKEGLKYVCLFYSRSIFNNSYSINRKEGQTVRRLYFRC